MDLEDYEMQRSISSHIMSLMNSYDGEEVSSAEDTAWIDSCLVNDPETFNGNWDLLKDALLDILSPQPESFNSASGSDGFSEGTDLEKLMSNDKAETEQFQGNTENDLLLTNEEGKADGSGLPRNLKENTLQSIAFEGNPFLPTYTEGKEDQDTESELGFGSSTFEMEPLSEDIFKVWDLGIPAEEGELDKQLKQALTGSSQELISSTSNASGQWEDLEEETLDNMIASMADLSLNKKVS